MPTEDPTSVDRTQPSLESHDEAAHDLDVVAIGSPLLDVIELASDEQLAQVGLEKGSMTLIDLVTANAVQEFMGAPRFVSGGSVANTTAGIAELGGTAGFVGAVADDEVGRTYTENLRAAGVEFEPHYSESAAGDGLGHGPLRGPDHRGCGPHHGHLPRGGVHAVARGRPDLLRGPGLGGPPRGLSVGRPRRQGGHAPRRRDRPRVRGIGGAVAVRSVLREPPPARVPRPARRRRRHPARATRRRSRCSSAPLRTGRPSRPPRRPACWWS